MHKFQTATAIIILLPVTINGKKSQETNREIAEPQIKDEWSMIVF